MATYEPSGTLTTATKTADVAANEAEFTVSVPTSTQVDVTVYQDTTGDGSADNSDALTDISSGTYSLTGFEAAAGAAIGAISVDGTGVAGVTIDGTDVSEVTMDGDVVWQAGSDIPDSVVAQYDATEEGSTGGISSITDRVGSFDLSGNASVISSGINSNQTYRFDGTDDSMSQGSSMATSDPFAVVAVIQQQEAVDANIIYFDGGSDTEFLLYENDSGGWAFFRGTSRLDDTDGTKDQDPHLWTMEAFGGDQLRVERDGTELVNGATASSDLTGFILGDRAGGGDEAEIDVGQLEVLEGHSDTELQDVQNRLADKWGITL